MLLNKIAKKSFSTSREERCCSAFTVSKLRFDIQEHTP